MPMDRLSPDTIPLDVTAPPAHSLVVQSMALESTASTNGDGFGLGFVRASIRKPELIARCVRTSDENLLSLPPHPLAPLLRPRARLDRHAGHAPNCHPFACGRWLFMHNGMIGNWTRMRRQVVPFNPDEFYGSRIGTFNWRRCSSRSSAPAATRTWSAPPAGCSPS